MYKSNKKMLFYLIRKRKKVLILILFLSILRYNAFASTRWSTIQFVPNADLIGSGDFISSIKSYFFDDISEGKKFQPSVFFDAGIKDWINLEAGFAGSFTFGVKAKILDEHQTYLPSFAIGVRNIFYHRECWYFSKNSDSLGSEIYFVIGKSIEPIRLRLHTGLQSIPYSENDLINPFIAIEKYLGAGFYVTAEAYRREKKANISLFIVCKLLQNRLGLSVGLIDLYGMFSEREGLESVPFYKSNSSRFIRPGIWMSVSLNTPIKAIKNADGVESLEDKFVKQSKEIEFLKIKIDSLQKIVNNKKTVVPSESNSELDEKEQLEYFVKKKLSHINTLYKTEPFEPESIKIEIEELEAKGEKILPILYKIALDTTNDNKISCLAVSIMGRINSDYAEDLIVKILKEDYNSELTVESLIALGKRNSIKNISIIKNFTNHSNSDIAFTASEVLEKLEKEESSNKELEK